MRRNVTALLLAGLLLALTGCQLAKPEVENGVEDRLIGLYMVYSQGYDDGFSDNPYLTEYGSETLDTGKYGSVSIPRQVLLAEYDEAARQYVFPGLEGYALFIYTGTNEDGSAYNGCCSDMADSVFAVNSSDEGERYELEGTIYFGPPAGAGPDWDTYTAGGVWHAYRVYQPPEGVPYLDGSGNSYSGGGGMSFTEAASYTATVNGETAEDTISVKVSVEAVPRLEKLAVSQFDGTNTLLQSEDLAPAEALPEISCLPETAWVLVEERFADGTVERTAYNVPGPDGEPISHPFILLDSSGLGTAAQLTIQ